MALIYEKSLELERCKILSIREDDEALFGVLPSSSLNNRKTYDASSGRLDFRPEFEAPASLMH